MVATAHRPAWTAEEIAIFNARVLAGVQAHRIADELGRTVNAVVSRKRLSTPSYARRRAEAAVRRMREQQVAIENGQPVPPLFVLHERNIRCQIRPASTVAALMGDPRPGYTAKDTKRRKLSVQDAIEICDAYSGQRGDIAAMSRAYRVRDETIKSIISGDWFDRLLPTSPTFDSEL